MTCHPVFSFFFFFNDTATTEIYTLSLHDALPISRSCLACKRRGIDDPRCPGDGASGGRHRGGDRLSSQGGPAGFLAHVHLVLSRARGRATSPRSSRVLARPRVRELPARSAHLRLERRGRLRRGPIQSAQGNVPVRGTRHAGTTRALALANGAGAGAVCNPVHAVTRTQGARVVRGADRGDRGVQLPAVCVQGTSGFGRAEPSWLPARLRARELAEPRVTGALVYVPFRCHVCDALPSVRRNHGLGTRSTRRPPDTRRCPTRTTGQVAVGCVSRC